ncbi:MAG: electron transfer flavoprotein-ubiquinone oxidoreductase [Burkholderiales bacterium]
MSTPQAWLDQYGPRESMSYDVLVVGAGPAGLAAAIRLKQKARAEGKDISVLVLDKGSEPGAHILSGAIMDPVALTELFPDWRERGAPLKQLVTRDEMWFLTRKEAHRSPVLPACFRNEGYYIISLGAFTRWLAGQAEALGVEIFSGFSAAELLFNAQGAVMGVATGNMGVGKEGQPHKGFQLGMELQAKYTLLAEGSRGHLGKQVIARYHLDAGKAPQNYALGIKELWEIDPARHKPGHVIHTAGWPMDAQTYGGGFLYHMDEKRVTLGLITGLDYRNPWLSPFEEMQRWKTHPTIRAVLEGGRRIGYGARSITAGGLSSLPKMVFPGGALIGCDAGTLNASRIKGSHAAIKSGTLAADATFEAVVQGRAQDELTRYPEAFEASWLYRELHQGRNFKAWFKKGLWVGIVMTGIEQWLLPKLGWLVPWTLRSSGSDHEALRPAADCSPIEYPKPDGKLTFDRLSSVFLSNTAHEDNQPAHLTLKDASIPVSLNLARYAGPESRYCPAGVYEFVPLDSALGTQRLQINAQNCIHCKTCDIKDPSQNIVWVTPEGGGGPNYSGM